MSQKTLSICSIILLTQLAISCSKNNKKSSNIQEHIGLIEFDPHLDTLGFELCHEDLIYPYFHHHDLSIKGEKPYLVQQFKESFQPLNKGDGYVTIRFVVNCDGASGRFRVLQMDENYVLKEFDEDLIAQLYHITKSLKDWHILEDNGEVYDYIRYLTFKIRNGDIVAILP